MSLPFLYLLILSSFFFLSSLHSCQQKSLYLLSAVESKQLRRQNEALPLHPLLPPLPSPVPGDLP